jgi:hypothetical protein
LPRRGFAPDVAAIAKARGLARAALPAPSDRPAEGHRRAAVAGGVRPDTAAPVAEIAGPAGDLALKRVRSFVAAPAGAGRKRRAPAAPDCSTTGA